MKRSLMGAALAGLLLVGPGYADAQGEGPTAAPRFTAETVFTLEYADDPQIAPDGRSLVYVRKSMDRMKDRVVGDIWTIDLETGAHAPLITAEGTLSRPRWSPDGSQILYVAPGEAGVDLRVFLVDAGRSFSLGQFDEAPSGAAWSSDGQRIVFSAFVAGEAPSFATPIAAPKGADWAEPVRVFDDIGIRYDGAGYLREGASQIFVIPAEGGSPRQLTNSENGFSSPQWLGNGALIIEGNEAEDPDLDPIESDLYRLTIGTGDIVQLTDRDGPDTGAAVSPDGRQIAYVGFTDEVKAYQQADLFVMDATGGPPRNLSAEFDRSIGAIAWSADGESVIAHVDDSGAGTLVRFSSDGRSVDQIVSDLGGTSIGRPYSGGAFDVGAVQERRRRRARPVIAYTQMSPDRPAEIAVIRNGGAPETLTRLNEDALGHVALAEIEAFTATSPVGDLPIEAWIALPPGFEADGTYPMIIEIHGGPFAMYGPSFAAEIQRFAAEGYVTVYANPRGSTGYGEGFAQEINLAYPGHDHDDLMAVVDALIAKNYVDPGRLFITGGSGGGVLTADAVSKTDRFVAAASIKPVINWTTMALAADSNVYFAKYWMQAMPWENPERYWSLSPISRVGNVKTPTLMMVGEEDWRTPTWEAEQFYTALKLQGVDTALIRIPGASHSIASRPSLLNAKVDNIMGWFAKYDTPRADPVAGTPNAAE
ncbi:MAG: S9 family peptidase [Pseudomonadota bacterium]